MERILYIDATANRARVSSTSVGTQGEVAATALSISFDESWQGLTKRLLWRTADGAEAVYVTLPEQGGDGRYISAVPALPLTVDGYCSLTLEGFSVDGDSLLCRARSIQIPLFVEPNDSFADREAEGIDATLAEQLQAGFEAVSDNIASLGERVDSITEALDGKASKSHGHTASQITCYGIDGMAALLQEEIADIGDAIAAHTHNFSAADISYNGDSNLQEAVGALEEREAVSVYNYALSADGWTGSSAPYSRALSMPRSTDNAVAFITPAPGCSDAAFLAAEQARLRIIPQNGYCTVKAYGTRPALSIPVRVAAVFQQ